LVISLLHSREEFAVFMRTFEIHSDRRRWMQVFRGIDKDFDGSVSVALR
jgi:hypothetical protein